MTRMPFSTKLLVPFLLLVSSSFLFGQQQNSVLLVTIDTLRADRIGRGLTPNIDLLAAQGVSFSHAITPVPLTLPAHASLLTGLYPAYHGVRDFTGQGLADRFTTLAEIYQHRGFHTAAFVSAFVVDGTWGLNQGFETYYDHFEKDLERQIQPGTIERTGDQTIDRVLEWLQKRPDGPFFLWVHLFDPHSDYDPPEPFRSRFQSRPYDGEIAFADSQIGRLLRYLREVGLYEDLVIALTSDHGESLGQHGESEHGFFIYDATIRIPLIIKLPGRESPLGLKQPVSLIDVAPTLLQISGIQPTDEMQGQGLYALISKGSQPFNEGVYSETLYPFRSFGWHDLKAYRTGRYKYIEAPKPEFYDLEKDPGETENLFEKQPSLAVSHRAQLLALYEKYQSLKESSTPSPSPDVLAKLRALGYLGSSSRGSAKGPSSQLADPKDKIHTFNRILQAMDRAQSGQWEQSNRVIQELLESEPTLFVAYNLQGENYLKLGKVEAAVKQFGKALQLRPDWEEAAFNLARAYQMEENLEAAHAGFERVLRINPENFFARFNLGSLLMSTSLERALSHFHRALTQRPDFIPLQRNLGVTLTDLKRFSEAEPYLLKVLALDPTDSVSHNYLGITYRNTGRLELAIQHYQKALEINSQYTPARLNLAFAYRQAGDRVKAGEEFQAVCLTNPTLCERYRSFFRDRNPNN
ncbi:sulfatase-like hydrolase/transferase [Acidobacteria bacterium AH-259-D05]|nr:sulfatase-like hydrolase/transferase [Acidobacteria bacterium AH-259-D05]